MKSKSPSQTRNKLTHGSIHLPGDSPRTLNQSSIFDPHSFKANSTLNPVQQNII